MNAQDICSTKRDFSLKMQFPKSDEPLTPALSPFGGERVSRELVLQSKTQD
jgi:hypothetical protein